VYTTRYTNITPECHGQKKRTDTIAILISSVAFMSECRILLQK